VSREIAVDVPVLVEQVEGGGYLARTGEPFAIMADGTTADEAVQKVRELIEARLAKGAQLITLDIAAAHEHPWKSFAGTWNENDPAIKRWEELVEQYRRQIDEDPTIP
jgi:predicted RNase H-like HicB family nuclease